MVKVTFTFGHINPKPGFVSAWGAARTFVGHEAFDRLSHDAQINAVRQYVNR